VSYRTTAVLLAVLIVLAGVVYYVQKQPASDQAVASAKQPQIVSFNPSQATKLIITGGGKTTEVDRNGSAWKVSKPQEIDADGSRVDGWVAQIGNLTADRAIDSPSDLGTYGLAQPKLNVEVDLSSGGPVDLAFGDKTPDGADYYVRVPNDSAKSKSVYLVGATLGDDLNSALTTPPKALPTPTPGPTLVPGGTITPLPPLPTPGAGTPTAGP
jgi:hypothetical protein